MVVVAFRDVKSHQMNVLLVLACMMRTLRGTGSRGRQNGHREPWVVFAEARHADWPLRLTAALKCEMSFSVN